MALNYTAFIYFFLAVILIAQTSITIYNYNQTKQARDLNFYWTVAVLMMSITGLIIAGLNMFNPGGRADVVVGNGSYLNAVDLESLKSAHNINALKAKLETNAGNIRLKVNTELADKLQTIQAALDRVGAIAAENARAAATA